jgi:hypothetical protein
MEDRNYRAVVGVAGLHGHLQASLSREEGPACRDGQEAVALVEQHLKLGPDFRQGPLGGQSPKSQTRHDWQRVLARARCWSDAAVPLVPEPGMVDI